MSSFYANVKYIPAQLSFIDGRGPKMQYFNQEDKFTLNEVGAYLLKEVLFAHTGFIKNN